MPLNQTDTTQKSTKEGNQSNQGTFFMRKCCKIGRFFVLWGKRQLSGWAWWAVHPKLGGKRRPASLPHIQCGVGARLSENSVWIWGKCWILNCSHSIHICPPITYPHPALKCRCASLTSPSQDYLCTGQVGLNLASLLCCWYKSVLQHFFQQCWASQRACTFSLSLQDCTLRLKIETRSQKTVQSLGPIHHCSVLPPGSAATIYCTWLPISPTCWHFGPICLEWGKNLNLVIKRNQRGSLKLANIEKSLRSCKSFLLLWDFNISAAFLKACLPTLSTCRL